MANSSEAGMTTEETGGETPQFLRRGIERPGKKDAPFAKLSGLDDDEHLDADDLLTPASSGLPGSGEDGMAASGALPYDPHTNYLSPRPQFLRYNPGRLREIFLRRETGPEGAEGDSSGEGTPATSLPSPLPRLEHGLGDLEPSHDEESCEDMGEEEDDDDDTAEEERPSWCNLVGKVLLVLGILFSITGYISSMDSFCAPFSSQKFQTFEGDYLQTQDGVQESAANASMNSDAYSGDSMHTYMDSHLSSLDGFCKVVEGEQLQEEGKSMVNSGRGASVNDVTPNSNMVIIGDWPISSAEELQGETQMKTPENCDLRCSNDEVLKDLLALSEEEGDEYAIHSLELHERGKMVADESKLLVDDENLNAGVARVGGEDEVFMHAGVVPVGEEIEVFMNAGVVPVEGESEVFMNAGVVPLEEEIAVFMNAGVVPVEGESEVFMNAGVVPVEEEIKGFISTDDKVRNPVEGNRHNRDTISEEQVEDVMVEAEMEEPVGMTLELDKAAESPGRRATSGFAEKDGSFGGGGDGGFSLYGMEVAVTVLMAIALATFTFLRFPSPREARTLVKDDASASFPTSGWASEGEFELPTTEKLKRDFDLLAKTGRFGDHGSYCPAVELLKEGHSDSSISTEKYEELHGTHPPTVELLGEFSVAELGFFRTGDSFLGKKTTKANGRHPQSPEMSMSNSLATVDQSTLGSSTTESALQRQPDQEKLEGKQVQIVCFPDEQLSFYIGKLTYQAMQHNPLVFTFFSSPLLNSPTACKN
ncbi:hypothetical protein Taro_011176 [Colocasia esculenta]|uniref:Uncharacterized protein n=1 Tax=Colocasia esculenta TaxID=4460 RepID=A0A843U0V5_COLES|nr:hypothetical protein [Colocasia esculenta]